MRTITLTAADGDVLTGRLPESWDEVPLGPYCRLAGCATLPESITATAALVGLPAEPLLNQVSLYAAVTQAMPFLRELPPAGEPVTEFRHQGTRYVSAGHLRTLSAGQLEAIYTMQEAHADKPLGAAAGILAVLYWPAGKSHTPELHRDTTAAFATLPVSVAWPAVLDFLRSGAMECSTHIRTFSALSGATNQALDQLEAALPTSASCPFWRKPLNWALRRWIVFARATATMP